METFEACRAISDLLNRGNEQEARNNLIQLLQELEDAKEPYDELVNHLIRETGLYPYLQPQRAFWQERFVLEAFRVDVGGEKPLPLHREQSVLLGKLLSGSDLAVSAPTSFGKSFVIDAFISIKRPKTVVIIVPTIALTDETRRRLHGKFSREYRIITTADVAPAERNIFVFPQERALSYAPLFAETQIDILIVDEFYKASEKFDKERAPSLLRAILKLSRAAKQRYFLAPNIKSLNENAFTKGMEFVELDFNTVYLRKIELFQEIGKDENKKADALRKILKDAAGKSLIYAGTYASVDNVATMLTETLPPANNPRLDEFADWLSTNYTSTWALPGLIRRGTGIHTGQLHRALSQIQMRLFDEDNGLTNLISTSSIVEGVNTRAKNVVIWKCKNGSFNLNDFTYRNIVGRGGRMFKHFVGNVFVLEKPPNPGQTELELLVPDGLLADVDETQLGSSLRPDQIAKIAANREEMRKLVGDSFSAAVAAGEFHSTDLELLKNIAISMRETPSEWKGLGYLNSPNPSDWGRLLFKIINLVPGGWEVAYSKYVAFVQILSRNWQVSIPELLDELESADLGVTEFFRLERNVSFKLAALVGDVNTMHKLVLGATTDISPFSAKLTNAFLPRCVYELEEYGLPRTISKKLQKSGVMDFEDSSLDLHSALERLKEYRPTEIVRRTSELHEFDRYILLNFYDGIR